ncbi:ileal sodium/bile acid cotransporter-like [Oratosquilla oratoria]|uniref:ileal sodium/bile acid cotransporter-like n=1 Tax=Oratosquilla oratoria TaxID=337810 RepID=UPI003F75CF63
MNSQSSIVDLRCRISAVRIFIVTVLLVFISTAAGQKEQQDVHPTTQATRNAPLEPKDGVWFDPEHLKQIIEGEVHTVAWYTNSPGQVVAFDTIVDDKVVADVVGASPTFRGLPSDNYTARGFVNISAKFIGYNSLRVVLLDENGEELTHGNLQISVLLAYQNLNDIFTIAIGVLVALVYINMGATLDLEVIKQIVKKPIGPIVGITCQYLIMPLIAFGLGKLVFDDVLLQLGMFLNGTSPGGGASNMWTYLLGGSLDLSIMMTFCSTLSAFAAVPLWIFTLGRVIVGDAEFVIPYVDITVLIISLVVPCGFGLLLQRFFPKIAKFLEKLLTPMSLINILFTFTFGVYANRYVFSIFDWKILIAGFGLPSLGYLSGVLLGLLCRLPRKDVIAVSIETGIQNASVALFILKFTLEKPAGDLTAVVPCASVLMTPMPLLTALFLKKLYDWRLRRSSCSVTGEKEKNSSSTALGEKKKAIADDVAVWKDTSKSKAEEKSHVGGIDNTAADLKDDTV